MTHSTKLAFNRCTQTCLAIFVAWGSMSHVRSESPATSHDPAMESIPLVAATSSDAALEDLDSDAFSIRERARKRMERSGMEAIGTITAGLTHPSFEVRNQCRRLLEKLDDDAINEQLRRLAIVGNQANDIELRYWADYRHCVGDNDASRKVFASIVDRFREPFSIVMPRVLGTQQSQPVSIDPRRLEPDDLEGWAALLLFDAVQTNSTAPRIDRPFPQRIGDRASVRSIPKLVAMIGNEPAATSLARSPFAQARMPRAAQVALGLLDAQTGPSMDPVTDSPEQSRYRDVLRHLIGDWIERCGPSISPYDRLAIAHRYQCEPQIRTLCETILEGPAAEPRMVAMAMLSAVAIRHPALPTYLNRFRSDDRAACCWHWGSVCEKRIQTHLSDVVVAIDLLRNDIDPRLAGYTELRADSAYVFDLSSLGFPDAATRARCRDLAQRMIAASSNPPMATISN